MRPLVLLKAIGTALLGALGGMFAGQLGADALTLIAQQVWGWLGGQSGEGQRKAIEALAQATNEEINKQVKSYVREIAGDKPKEVQQVVELYLTHVPAMVRKTLRRASDPTGTTVPANLKLRRAEDVIAFLPHKLPRFKPGDSPFAGVDWQLVELLGVGGFGEVWLARNPHVDGVPPAALKFCLDDTAKKTLRHEAAVLNQVMRQGKHPGIVQLRQTYLSADPPCLEYEYVSGGDLAGLIREWHEQAGGPNPQQVAKVIFRLAEIIGYAHNLTPPIIHRDLKPANILVEPTKESGSQFKIADFGIGAIVAGAALNEAKRHTSGSMYQTSLAVGSATPLYASPQQMRREPSDPRDDVYSLGVIWYQFLTGDLTNGRPGGSKWRSRFAERGMSEPLLDLLESCFEENPNDRPADGAVLAEQLAALLNVPPAATSPNCPRCGFSFAWDGRKCGHCPPEHRTDVAQSRSAERLPIGQPASQGNVDALQAFLSGVASATTSINDEATTKRQGECKAIIDSFLDKNGSTPDPSGGWKHISVQLEPFRYPSDIIKWAEDYYLSCTADEHLWQMALQENSLESYERYLAACPIGRHADQAKGVISPILRAMLLDDIFNINIRTRYLSVRTQADKDQDSHIPFSFWLAYLVFGAFVGGFSGYVGAQIGAYIGDYLGWWWIFRAVPQMVTSGFVCLILGGLIGFIIQYGVTYDRPKQREGGFTVLGFVPGFILGLLAGAISYPFWCFVGGGILGVFVGGMNGKEGAQFGPLPFGAHPANPDDLKRVYLGQEKSAPRA